MRIKNYFLLLFLFSVSIINHAQTREVKYYNLVIDKLELPSCLKDTTASGEILLYISYDADRIISHYEKVILSVKSPTIVINQKMVDIKREDKINFKLTFTETGGKNPPPKDHFRINNLELAFDANFSAISEGKRTFYAKDLNHWDDFTGSKYVAYVILHWHLEPSKLQ
jgi:hypothetical protein